MAAKLVSNQESPVSQVYYTLQNGEKTVRKTRGTVLYSNGFSGIGAVPMGDDIKKVLENDLGYTAKNLLIQLEQKFLAFPNGPWFVDSRDGVIYIHNRKFNEPSEHKYIYQNENGEVLKVQFSTQYITKSVMQQVHQDINSDNKQIESTVSNTLEFDENDWKKHVHHFDFVENNRIVAVNEYGEAINLEVSPEEYQTYMNEHFNTVGANLDKAVKEVRQETEDDYQEYLSTQSMSSKAREDHYIQKSLNNYTDNDLESLYNESVLNRMTAKQREGLDKIIKGIKSPSDVSSLGPQLIKYFEEIHFKLTMEGEHAIQVPVVVEEDPRDAVGHKTSDKVGFGYDKPQREESQMGLKVLQADPTIKVFPDTFEENNSREHEYEPNHSYGQSNTTQKYKASVKVFKKQGLSKVINPALILTNLISRKQESVEAAVVNRNGGLKITEKKLICTMDVVGRPSLQSSQVISLLNVGTRWSGYWYIKRCTHKMDAGAGYICTMELVRNTSKSGGKSSKATVSTESIVSQNAKNSGVTDIGKDKVTGSKTESQVNWDFTSEEKAWYDQLKTSEEKAEFTMEAVEYREQNADRPEIANQGIVYTNTMSRTSNRILESDINVSKKEVVMDKSSKEYSHRKFDIKKAIERDEKEAERRSQ